MTAKASVNFSHLGHDIFNLAIECSKKNAEIRYASLEKMHIAGKSFFGEQYDKNSINFQILVNERPQGIEIYDYSKRGLDRKFIENFFDLFLSVIGQDADIKFEDLDQCGICKKKLRLGMSKFIPSIGWATCHELCESCFDLLAAHEKKYCCICQRKLGFRRYAAKIPWNRNLMLCKECYFLHKNSALKITNQDIIFEKSYLQSDREKSLAPIKGTDDPLHILKIRLAKGEISKEEYREMRKILED